jgi:hypothetical protein
MLKMAIKTTQNANATTREFTSINEFVQYIKTTPVNKVFAGDKIKKSHRADDSEGWIGTSCYTEAVNLMEHGWDKGALRLNEALKKELKKISQDKYMRRMFFDVVGFTPCVPRYIQGIPENMANQKKVVMKQKIITINKDVSFNGWYSAEDIIRYSANALAVVKKLEDEGYRVNLNIIFGSRDSSSGYKHIAKIRIKNASERFSVSKMAFLMAHPSMLRRFLFNYIEVVPEAGYGLHSGYGFALRREELLQYVPAGEIVMLRDIKDTTDETIAKVFENK